MAPSHGGGGRTATRDRPGELRNTLFREHVRARRTPRVAASAAATTTTAVVVVLCGNVSTR